MREAVRCLVLALAGIGVAGCKKDAGDSHQGVDVLGDSVFFA